MVTRRTALRLAGAALLGGVAGCTGERRLRNTPTRSARTTRTSPSPTPDGTTVEPTKWTPAWGQTVTKQHVLGITPHDGALYAALSTEGGPSAVAEVSPADGTVVWQTECDGEAVIGSYAGYRPMARDQWGVTPAGGHVYSVHGAADSYDWTAVHALDRTTGERRWSLRRERELAVHGVADGVAYATGREFFEPEHSHDAPEEPLASVLYALDADTGEVRWTDEFAGVADVAVGADAAYVADREGLVALDADGERRWRFSGEQPARSVRVAGDRVYYLAEVDRDRSTIRGLDLAGDREWKRTHRVSEALLDGDRLYVGGDAVLALDPDGSVAWRADAHGKWLLAGPETLYARAGGRAADAYARPGGEKLWSFDPPETYAWPEAATDGTAVVEGYGETRALYAVDRDRGDARRRYSVRGRASVFTVASLDDRVFVGDGRSTITALDA